VAEVKYFDSTHVFVDLIVDEDGTVQEFANTDAFSNDRAHARKTGQQLDVVEKGFAKTRSRFTVIFSNVTDDIPEIV